MSGLTVVSGGFLSTVQDRGRPGYAAIGVSASGAADPIALSAGNRLVGNRSTAAGIEMTLVGATVRFESAAVVAVTGADAAPRVDGRQVPGWVAVEIPPGATFTCDRLLGGARAYLCVRGGIEVPQVLGSASTHIATALGGLDGRPLRAGDRLPIGASEALPPSDLPIDLSDLPGYRAGEPFRVTEGTQISWFTREARDTLASTTWRVAEACDRMGIRLEGPALPLAAPRELVTEGVLLGSIQVPSDGRPIVLFVEHQTTGGYPKIASVASADAARLGQLRPRDAVRFRPIDFDEAVAEARAQAAELKERLR